MPDYGHPLTFGTFITPGNQAPEAPVALAELSERLGYDLVTFQDHPYQPSFLDTWTLLSWVAARTETIHLSGNVLNLPLRPPAVLARAAASLDLLSGGRFELGLGAGGFVDAVSAMGGPTRTVGQNVDALAEAIGIIRGIWDADERRPLRLEGEYYSISGGKRGPTPAHEIPIWLGAVKPRMLRLIGRLADGWLPSLFYLEPGALGRGNAAIDESATAAGRDPREIRRLLNIGGKFGPTAAGQLDGPPELWVEQLTAFALEDGVATFILAGDDPGMMQRFAAEVIPGVREAVDRERASSGTPQGRVRGAIVLAQRRDGIDYEALPASLAADAVEPGDSAYSSVKSNYLRGGAPGLVLRVDGVDQVRDALAFARAQNVPLGIRSGGHGISGRSTNDGGIVIDLGRMNAIEVLDESARLVRVGPGARWMDVAAELGKHGWALSSGDYGGVGVGGLATAGGVGWFAREHGLTIDHLRAVELVLADGTAVRASADEHPDLFWAVRGAGANFGIATAFEFVVDGLAHDVGFAQLSMDGSDVAGLLEAWGAAVEASPRDVTTELILGGRGVAQLLGVVDSDDPDTVIERLQPLAVAPLVDQAVQLMPYSAVMRQFVQSGPHRAQGEPNSRSGLIRHLTPEFAAAAERMLSTGDVYFFQLRSVGGAVSDVPADATAYAWRDANFSVVAMGSSSSRLDAAWEGVRSHLEGMYLSFESGLGKVEDAFPPATLARLRELKREWDPENVFRDNFSVAEVVQG